MARVTRQVQFSPTETVPVEFEDGPDGLVAPVIVEASVLPPDAARDSTLAQVRDRLPVSGIASETSVAASATALGAPADAEASGNGSVIGLLKRLRTLLGSVLTDAQLRAAPVPVSGSVEVVNDVGSPIPVVEGSGSAIATSTASTATALGTSGDAEATGNGSAIGILKRLRTLLGGLLTDAQLRAAPVSITGTVEIDNSTGGPVAVSADTLPLPTGAATEATLATLASATALGDAPAPATPRGVVLLGVRRDTNGPVADADGDYEPLQVNEDGRLKVAVQPGVSAAVQGTITANGQAVAMRVDRTSNVVYTLVGTGLSGHNCIFEFSNNSTNGVDGNWFVMQVVRSNANTIETATGALSATPAYGWEASVNGYAWVRVRATGHTGGTATWRLSPAPFATEPIPAAQVSATQPVSGTGLGIVGNTAHDAAISGNPVRLAGRAITANYTAVAGGDVADLITTVVGALVQRPYSIPEADWQAALTITGNTAVDIQAAAGAGLRRYCTAIQFQNTNATATTFSIRRGATVIANFSAPANMASPVPIAFPTPLQTAANEALNILAATTGANLLVNAQGYTAP